LKKYIIKALTSTVSSVLASSKAKATIMRAKPTTTHTTGIDNSHSTGAFYEGVRRHNA